MLQKMEKNSQICFVWKHNGEECPFIALAGSQNSENQIDQLALEFKSYALIENDLNTAKKFFALVRSKSDENDTDYIEAIFEMAIMAYSRPFTEGEGRSRSDGRPLKLHGDQIFKGKRELKDVHQQLLDFRNKFSAHSGGTSFEDVLLYVALTPASRSKAVLEMYRGMIRVASMNDEFNQGAIQAINFVLDWIKPKQDDLYSKIMGLMRAIDIEDLYRDARFPEALGPNVQKVFISK